MYSMALFRILLSISLLDLVYSADDVALVIVGVQPGISNPSNFLPTDGTNGEWAWEGKNQLNNFGKEEALKFGRYLRERYAQLLSQDFYADEMVGISSTNHNCQKTMLSLFAGLYPTSNRAQFDFELKWQPIPLKFDNKALGISQMECSFYNDLVNTHMSDSDLWSTNSNLSSLVIYLTKNAGVKPTVQGMLDVLQNWRALKSIHKSGPSYLEYPTLSGYQTGDAIYSTLEEIEDDTRTVCSKNSDCQVATSGTWLRKILDHIEDARSNKTDVSVIVNVAEADNIMSLLKIFQVEHPISAPASGFLLEFRQTPVESVRLLLHELEYDINLMKTSKRRVHSQRLQFCNYMEWCPLDVFMSNMNMVSTSSRYCNAAVVTKPYFALFALSFVIIAACIVKLNN